MRLSLLLLSFAVVCFGFAQSAFALTDKQVKGAERFVDSLAQDAISFLSDEKLDKTKRAAKFETLLNTRFDMKAIGRFAMGRYWRNASKAQQAEYIKLFNDRIIDVYSRRFEEYEGQTLKVVSSSPQGDSDAAVYSLMSQPSGPDIHLDWRIRYKDGEYHVIDVIVEGVSMALTQRSDFASVIQRGGGDVSVLIAHLKEDN